MVLPLYMVLLGGICWTGELILAKQKAGDGRPVRGVERRQPAPHGQGGIRGKSRNKYFNMAEVGEETVYEIVHEAWDRGRSGRTRSEPRCLLVMRMAGVDQGLLAGSPSGWDETAPGAGIPAGPECAGPALAARGVHAHLFGDYAYRSRTGRRSNWRNWSMPWEFYVCQEEWPKVSYLHDMAPQELILPGDAAGAGGVQVYAARGVRGLEPLMRFSIFDFRFRLPEGPAGRCGWRRWPGHAGGVVRAGGGGGTDDCADREGHEELRLPPLAEVRLRDGTGKTGTCGRDPGLSGRGGERL